MAGKKSEGEKGFVEEGGRSGLTPSTEKSQTLVDRNGPGAILLTRLTLAV